MVCADCGDLLPSETFNWLIFHLDLLLAVPVDRKDQFTAILSLSGISLISYPLSFLALDMIPSNSRLLLHLEITFMHYSVKILEKIDISYANIKF